MPANEPDRVYLDSNVFIAFVQDEVERADIVRDVLEDGRQLRIEPITSVLTMTEVVYAAADISGGELTQDAEARIDRLWEPNTPVTLVDASTVTSIRARELIRSARLAGFKLKPYDAQHLAAAMLYGAVRVFTYEKEDTRSKWSALVGMPVQEPWAIQPGFC